MTDPAAVAASLRELADTVAALPRDIEARLRERDGEVPIEIIREHGEMWAAWARYAAEHPPRAPINLYRSLAVVRELIVPEVAGAFAPYRERSGAPIVVRTIIRAEAVVTEDDRLAVDRLIEAGVDVRLAADVPSWIYADAGLVAGIPLEWGEDPPSGIMLIRDPALSTAIAALLEPMWAAAEPWRAPTHEWTDTLRLAALGLSDTAIAAAQGTSHRTVQRRIAEAMAHYRVRSRFELGAAWERAARPSAGDGVSGT
ncbi:MAG: hypothetical protein J7480_09090 [Microbacteriaceae bacterium]|nr:hypothetical protein [Microbacteriaceae bacterium]